MKPAPNSTGKTGKNLAFAIKHARFINDWEKKFLLGASGYAHLSSGQREKLEAVIRKIEAALQLEAGDDLR